MKNIFILIFASALLLSGCYKTTFDIPNNDTPETEEPDSTDPDIGIDEWGDEVESDEDYSGKQLD